MPSLILEPKGGVYASSVTVGISVKFDDGTICEAQNLPSGWYVLFVLGSTAGVYRVPITITQTSTLEASLFCLFVPYGGSSETYTIVQPILSPSFSPVAGTYHNYNNGDNFQVALSSEQNTFIFYTTDGSEPTTSSTKYSSLITFVKSTTLQAKAYTKNLLGMYSYSSPGASATYVLKTAAPSIKPHGGTYHNAPLRISMTSATNGALIRYTTDKSTPGARSGNPYTPFLVDKKSTITARAFRKNFEDSDPTSETYIFKVATPVIQPPSGTYTGNIGVSISCETAMARIFYTNSQTVGAPPNGTTYAGSFPVWAPLSFGTATVIVTAKATRKGFINSETTSATYILKPLTPGTSTTNPF